MSIDLEEFAIGFGQRLRLMRALRGLTQFELAHRAGYSKNFISNLERGFQLPSLSTVFVLSETLEASPKDILFGAEEQSNGRRD